MKQDYSWVADVQRQAMAQKLARRGMPSYNQRPISERYGASYTGEGPDGEVDKSAPAGMDLSTDPPHIFHQGETRLASPMGGAVYLNSDVTQSLNPAAFERWQGERDKMKAMEGQLPGFAAGGLATNNPELYNTIKQAGQYITSVAQPPQTNTNTGNTTGGKAGSAAPTGGTNTAPGGGIPGGAADTLAGNNQRSAGGETQDPPPPPAEPPSVGYLREAENNYVKPDWGRDAEGTRRIADMRQEAASAQAYQQHQQAMRGTDANAAWAQGQMLAAQQESGINNFAAEYARGLDERNWGRLHEMAQQLWASGDPTQVAQAAMMYNDLFPGTGIDFSADINAAYAGQLGNVTLDAKTLALTMDKDSAFEQINQIYGKYNFPKSVIASIVDQAYWTDAERDFNTNILPNLQREFPTNTDNEEVNAANQLEIDVATEGYWQICNDVDTGRAAKEDEEKAKKEADKKVVQNIISGVEGFKFEDYASTLISEGGKESPTYNALLEATPEWTIENSNVQKAGKRKGVVIGNKNKCAGYNTDVQLDKALEKGTPINVGGVLYYVESATPYGYGKYTVGGTKYVLRDPLTKNPIDWEISPPQKKMNGMDFRRSGVDVYAGLE